MSYLLYGVPGAYVNCTAAVLAKFETKAAPGEVSVQVRVPAADWDRCKFFGRGDPATSILKHVRFCEPRSRPPPPRAEGKSEEKRTDDAAPAPAQLQPSASLADVLTYDEAVVDSTVIDANHAFAVALDGESQLVMPDWRAEQHAAALAAQVHHTVKLVHGSWCEELPEQLMIARFVRPTAHVLELGANWGRSTLMIASILERQANLVTLECDHASVAKLNDNKRAGGFGFAVEASALSARPLVQSGWNTRPLSDFSGGGAALGAEALRDWKVVPTITWAELTKKYAAVVPFDTLVADCEGALYHILRDAPEMLVDIRTVVMENDYGDIEHKRAVDAALTKAGLLRVYAERGGWGVCEAFFFEAWQRPGAV
jgi:FkbM family methyltransferase